MKYRTYCCLKCGLVMDRDLNAALNLEREARRILQEALLVPVVDSGSGPTEKRLWRPRETEAGS
ncbi:hypothetical protein KDH_07340 [Dictyobacter sp. S3.2.2.5]|uniref:Cas12f1-like TNB domain-containing protein n=1 Tax=Dictyobacter halimunensis TaxID=3026934 RepID=A0ABQ6FKY5_9CHLR|nr:hypothetical protein KDH_07340 [Dictyobacter sp. S3.2.2.5]